MNIVKTQFGMQAFRKNIRGQAGWIALGVFVFFAAWIAYEGTFTYPKGIGYETTINAQWNSNQIVLSEGYMTTLNGFGIANAKKNGILEAFDKTVQTFGKGSKEDFKNSPLVLALHQTFPGTDWSSIYDKLFDQVIASQQKFAQYQTQMQSIIKPYDDFLHPTPVNFVRFALIKACFPSNALRATIGKETVRGEAALELMRKPVTSQAGDDAFRDGQQKPIDFSGGKK